MDPHPSSDVILLFGGTSHERRVSVASAQHMLGALAGGGDAPPACWFQAPGGAVHEVTAGELLGHGRPFEIDIVPAGAARWPALDAALDALTPDSVVLMGLHGGAGEDGSVQRLLEERGLAFTGSGSAASANAFDKALAHEIVWCHGLRVPEACVIDGRDLFRARAVLTMLLARYDRAVLKPVADGASVGLCLIHDQSDLEKALGALREAPETAHLAEAFVEGVELTVGVVDEPQGPRALPCSEVRIEPGRHFDYAAKYLGRGAREITPAEVAPEIARAAQDAALLAHRALECRGYSRTDVVVDAVGPVFLETNTLPGLSAASFLPAQLEAAGVGLGDFLRAQIERERERARAVR